MSMLGLGGKIKLPRLSSCREALIRLCSTRSKSSYKYSRWLPDKKLDGRIKCPVWLINLSNQNAAFYASIWLFLLKPPIPSAVTVSCVLLLPFSLKINESHQCSQGGILCVLLDFQFIFAQHTAPLLASKDWLSYNNCFYCCLEIYILGQFGGGEYLHTCRIMLRDLLTQIWWTKKP
jgi:hypothetical protein